jgi:hypothetical protein
MKRGLFVALVCVIAFGSELSGQSFFESTPPLFTSASWGEKNDLVDFDKDGDLDVLTFTSSVKRVTENASGRFVEKPSAFGAIAIKPIDYVLCDYDLDNDVDILFVHSIAQYSLKLQVAKNNGDLTFSIENVSGITSNWFEGSVHWVDLDADGDSDIVFNDVYQNYSMFMNTNGTFTKSAVSLPTNLHLITWADVNNDGLMDFAAARGETYPTNPVYVFINKGEGHFEMKPTPIVSGANPLFWMDANQDGSMDLLVQKGSSVQLFKNKFAETKSEEFEFVLTTNLSSVRKFEFNDLNTDGRMDFINAADEVTTAYINTCTNSTFSFEQIDLTIQGKYNYYLEVADFNDDSNPDIIYYGRASTGDASMVFLKNTSVIKPPLPAPANLQTQMNEEFILLSWEETATNSDIQYSVEIKNGDTYFRSALSSASGKPYLTEPKVTLTNPFLKLSGLNAGTYTWRVQTVDGAGRGSAFSEPMAFVLHDPPGPLTFQQPELTKIKLEWTDNSSIETGYAVYRRSESRPMTRIATLPANTTTFEDSNLDLNVRYEYVVKMIVDDVLSAPSNAVAVYNEQFSIAPFDNPPNIVTNQSVSADVDNDNDYDLLFNGGLNYGYGRLFYLKNNLGNFSVQSTPYVFGQNEGKFYVRDIDNDNDEDICIVFDESNKRVRVLRNDNGQFTVTFQSEAYPYIPQFQLEDFNNDGLLDIIFTHENGNATGTSEYTILSQKNISDFTVSEYHFVPLRNQLLTKFVIGDFDADSYSDIIFAAIDYTPVKAYKNLNGNSFTQVSTNLPSFTGDRPFDYNQDGRLDVVYDNLVYFGNNDFTFTRSAIETPFPVAVGDFDLNGIPDLISSEKLMMLGKGDGEYDPVDFPSGLGSIVTDLENDGDLDLIQLKRDQHEGLNSYYTNRIVSAESLVINNAPSIPENLNAAPNRGNVRLTWNTSVDDKTPAEYISYNLELIDENGKYIFNPETNSTGSFRKRFGAGNLGNRTNFTINDLPAGNYSARLQALDASYALSGFSEVRQFEIVNGVENLAFQKLRLNKIKLLWSEAIDNETSIVIERRTVYTDFVEIGILPANTLEFVDDNLAFDEVYFYRIYATIGDISTSASVIRVSTSLFSKGTSQLSKLVGGVDVADFNNDGKMDLVTSGVYIVNNQYQYRTDISENAYPDFNVTNAALTNFQGSYQLSALDLTGDHRLDIFQYGFSGVGSYNTKVFVNSGNNMFEPQTNLLTSSPNEIRLSWDFDSDNDLDFFVRDQSSPYPIFRFKAFENRSGTYALASEINLMDYYRYVTADFDKDGDEDVLESTGNYFRNIGKELPAFGAPVTYVAALPGEKHYITDYNTDGWPDVIVMNNSPTPKNKLFRHTGKFATGGVPQFEFVCELPGGNISSGDLNFDGTPDLVIAGNFRLSVHLSNGDGTFKEIKPSYVQEQNNRALIVDIDNDGDLDVVVSSENPNVVLYNNMIDDVGGISNEAPNAPAQLTTTIVHNGVELSWSASADDSTPTAGLSYDVIIYDLDGNAITKAAIDPVTGTRQKLQGGRSSATKFVFNNTITGGFRWTVQAVDNSFKGSALAPMSPIIINVPEANDTTLYSCNANYFVRAKGENIEWFADEQLTQKIHEGQDYQPVSNGHLYITQTVSGVRSAGKHIFVTILARPEAPIMSPEDVINFCSQTDTNVAISAHGTNITWYADSKLSQRLASGPTLQIDPRNIAVVYATQTISNCESKADSVRMHDTRPPKPATEPIVEYCVAPKVKINLFATGSGIINWYSNETLTNLVFTGPTFSVIPLNEQRYFVTQAVLSCRSEAAEVLLAEKDGCIVTSIEQEWGSSVVIYPNPAKKNINIKLGAYKALASIEVTNILGQSVIRISSPQFSIDGYSINTENFDSGLYILRLKANDSSIVIKRVVID